MLYLEVLQLTFTSVTACRRTLRGLRNIFNKNCSNFTY